METFMGTFSIWEWIIEFLVVGLPVIGIATAGNVKQMQRKDYALRVAGLLIVGLIFGYLVTEFVLPENLDPNVSVGLAVAAVPLVVAFGWLWARWSAHRLNHMGRSRWWALLVVFPVTTLLAAIALCVIPGRPQEAVQADPG